MGTMPEVTRGEGGGLLKKKVQESNSADLLNVTPNKNNPCVLHSRTPEFISASVVSHSWTGRLEETKGFQNEII